MNLSSIRWTEWSEEHIARHDVTAREVEEVCFSGPLFRRGRGRGERRSYLAYGQTAAGRYLLVVLRPEGRGSAFVITARDMDLAERRRYRGARR